MPGLNRLVDIPEINVAIFAFLLNLTWEFAQILLFAEVPTGLCARAAELAIALLPGREMGWGNESQAGLFA